MAVTDGMLGLVIGAIAVYVILIKNPVRVWRMIGSVMLTIIGIGFGLIADTAIMFIPGMVCILIGVISLLNEVPAIIKD